MKQKLRHLGKVLFKAQADDKESLTYLSGYALRFKDNLEEIEPKRICFSYLNSTESKTISEFVFSLKNRFGFEKKDNYNFATDKGLIKSFNQYLFYIFNESPFKDFFITKRVCDAHRYGVKCNTNKLLTEYLTGCVAIREYWEHVDNLSTWNVFVKEGVHKDIALILAYLFQQDGIGKFKVKNIFATGHALFGCSSKKMLSDFLVKGCYTAGDTGYAIFETTRTKCIIMYADNANDPILALIKNPIKSGTKWSETTSYLLKDIKEFALQWEKDLDLKRNYK